MLSENKKSIVVVGSGIAGLTAAYRLQQSGFSVTVLEAKHIVGGRMTTEMRGSFNAFTGATGLYSFYTEMWELFEELGLIDKLNQYPTFGKGIMGRKSGAYEFDSNRTISMLWHKGLRLSSRLRLPFLLPDFIKARLNVNPNLLHTATDFDDETMAEYLIRKVGKDFYEYIVAPVYRTLWTWDPDNTTRAYFLSIYAHTRGKPCYRLEGGLGTLTNALADKLSVHCNTKVIDIEPAGLDNKRVIRCMTDEGEKEYRADIVVNAVEGWHVDSIVKHKTDYEEAFFKHKIPYAQYYMASFVLNESRPDLPSRTYFSRDNQSPLSFMHTFPGSDEPGDVPRIWAILGADRGRHYVGPNGEGLAETLKRFIREKVPELDSLIKEEHMMYDDYYIAAFPTGQLKRVKQFLTGQESGPKNMYYVGEYLSNATTGGACAIADRTAKLIAEHWGS